MLSIDPTKWSWAFKEIQSGIFFHPQVPQLYKIKGYQPFSIQRSSTSYRPQKVVRALKQGAEVRHPTLQELLSPVPSCPGIKTNTLLLVLEQDEATTVIALPKQDITPQFPGKTSILSMKPPEALAVSPDYDPLYIFVSDNWQESCVLCSFISTVTFRKTDALIGNIFICLEYQDFKNISFLKLLAWRISMFLSLNNSSIFL